MSGFSEHTLAYLRETGVLLARFLLAAEARLVDAEDAADADLQAMLHAGACWRAKGGRASGDALFAALAARLRPGEDRNDLCAPMREWLATEDDGADVLSGAPEAGKGGGGECSPLGVTVSQLRDDLGFVKRVSRDVVSPFLAFFAEESSRKLTQHVQCQCNIS